MAHDITQVDYEQLGAVAAQFGQQAEEIQQIQSAVQADYERLEGGDFKGDAARNFFGEMRSSIFPAFQRLTAALIQAQSVTNDVGKLIGDAEREAAALFNGGYGGGTSSGGGASGSWGDGNGSAPAQEDKPWWQRGLDTLRNAGNKAVDMVQDAGSFLYNQGERALNAIEDGISSVVGAAKDLGNAALSLSDRAIDAGLSQILPTPEAGGAEKITVKLDGNLTIPGIEVGLPGSIKLKGAESATLTHNPDGTYSLTISDGGGIGLEETTGGASGSVTVGNSTKSAGLEASGNVMLNGGNSITFKFDPNNPGDMTKMAAFGGALGMPGFPAVAAAPALYMLKDNLTGFKVEGGVSVEGQLSAALGSGNLGAGITGGGEMRLNSSGQQELVTSVQVSGKGGGELGLGPVVAFKGGGEGSVQIQNIHNMATGTDQAQVTVTLTRTGAGDLKALQSMLPPGANISKANFGVDGSQKITVEYTLNHPASTIQQTFFNGGSPDLGALAQQSTIAVKTSTGSNFTLGAEGSVALPTQKIGIGGSVSVGRESESTVYTYDGATNQSTFNLP